MSCVTVSSCLAANTGIFFVATDSAIIIFYKQQLPFFILKNPSSRSNSAKEATEDGQIPF